jgi:exosortase D (VPLPA-CTERM-specific)
MAVTEPSLRGTVGLGMLILTIISAGFFFQDGIGALLVAWQTPEYSHGPLIPVLSALIFVREVKAVPPVRGPVNDRWPGVLVLFIALALGALGKFARIDDVVAYALIVFVAGVLLTNFGLRRGWVFWPSVIHLCFMLPLPATIYWKLSTFLQSVSSEIGVLIIQLMNIPVYLDGNIIDLGVYKLHVAEACSGLRYLFPIMSFSYVFAVLYKGPIWHKLVLLLSAAPLAVLMNSIRIGIIGIIVDRTGIEHVEGLTHLLEGWVIFLTCVILLFGLARVLMLLQGNRMTLGEALDLNFEGFGPQIARIFNVVPSAALAAGMAMFAIASVGWQILPDRQVVSIEREPLGLVPYELGYWQRVALQPLEPDIERVLGASDYVSAIYQQPVTGNTVDLFIAWYEDQTRGGIHSPEVCLPGGGWEMAEIVRTDIADRIGYDGSLPINRAVIQKGESKLLVYYWFEQYANRTASDVYAKAALLVSAARHGRTDGALVRLITPIARGESTGAAEERLLSATAPLMEELRRFVPRHPN